jgi:hypothetical protein
MLDNVIDQAEEAIDEIVPGAGFVIQAPLHEGAVYGG